MLPGAGARGAYQVGVLRAVASILPKQAPNPFAVISGTSAGAINAAVLASRADHFERAVHEMEHVWDLLVPLNVDVGHGANWLAAQH